MGNSNVLFGESGVVDFSWCEDILIMLVMLIAFSFWVFCRIHRVGVMWRALHGPKAVQ